MKFLLINYLSIVHVSKLQDIYLETEYGRTFTFLDNADFYNEFGLELREEYYETITLNGNNY